MTKLPGKHRWISAAIALAGLLALNPAQAFEPFHTLPATPPVPEDNAQSPAKAALGRLLFFDPRLSVNGKLSCNSCHDVLRGGTDHKRYSTGASGVPATRNTPTLWNVAYQTAYFWDGRASSLEQAIAEHILDAAVMGMPDKETLVARLDNVPAYQDRFRSAFGGTHRISYEDISKALASHIRTLVTPNGSFDRYLAGDKGALSESARRGQQLFVEKGCAACHFWVNFSGPLPGLAIPMGEGFYELFPTFRGSRYDAQYNLLGADMGRYHIDQREDHKYLWRVPSLRNVELTAPYFHNGSVETLDEAVRVMAKVQFNFDVNADEVDSIVSFLKSLTGEFPPQQVPALP